MASGPPRTGHAEGGTVETCQKKRSGAGWPSWAPHLLVPAHGPHGLGRQVPGGEVALVGHLGAVAVGVEAAGAEVLADLRTPLGRRLQRPGHTAATLSGLTVTGGKYKILCDRT